MTKDDLVNLLRSVGADPKYLDIIETAYTIGWNSALDDASKQISAMPFGNDTIASFTVFIKSLKT
jgi:hypothetical protein